MSESPKKEGKFKVLADDFIAFLEAKTPEANCPACGAENWTVLGLSESKEATRLNLSVKNSTTPKAVPVFALNCVNCGNVRFHLARNVSKWIEDGGLEDEAECENGTDA